MKVLINTIDKDLEIVFKGSKYILESNGKMLIDSEAKEDLASHWIKNIHQFLTIEESVIDDKISKAEEKKLKEKEILKEIAENKAKDAEIELKKEIDKEDKIKDK